MKKWGCYLLDSFLAFTKAQIFLVISLGGIGFLPNICSAVSLRPAKLMAYPPNAFFLALGLAAPDFGLGLALDVPARDLAFFLAAKSLRPAAASL